MFKQIMNIEFLKKIHSGADETCFTSILTDWKNSQMDDQAQEIFDLLCDGLSIREAGKAVGLCEADAVKLIAIVMNTTATYMIACLHHLIFMISVRT